MEAMNKNQLTEELALLLIYLSSWQEKTITGEDVHHAWKGYDFALLDALKEKGFIDFSNKAQSLIISEEGIQKAISLLKRYETV